MTTYETSSTQPNRTLVAILTFLFIVIILMVIALLNAPTMGGPKVMASASTYLQEVRRTALPFLGAVAVLAIALGSATAMGVGWGISRPLLRLHEHYLAMATLAFSSRSVRTWNSSSAPRRSSSM